MGHRSKHIDALKQLADAIEKHTSSDDDACEFCNICPAKDLCDDDACFDDGNCLTVIMKWTETL